MLKHTFIHIAGIGLKKERALWEMGVRTWDDFDLKFLAQRNLFSDERTGAALRAIDESRAALQRGDLNFFAERLPRNQHYRIALTEPDSTIFVDIETTGLSLHYDQTTLIGVASRSAHCVHIKGEPIEPIADLIRTAKCVITFNGTIFDLKFLAKGFPALPLPKAHVDLRFFGLPFGFRGTQKLLEEKFGYVRPPDLQFTRGEKAPLLWYRYTRGDLEAGVELLKYNHCDIEGMKFLLDRIFDQLLASNGASQFYTPPRFFPEHGFPSSTVNSTEPTHLAIRPYTGQIGPAITYEELTHSAKNLRVVGIDLSGSERRPSGWCLLKRSHATTKLLRTDKEIVKATLEAQPHIVSIDSPLSLPKGRRRVTNDDPGRAKFGIMRECERTLKKRGVNVYPCLIDSMQKLTARGMLLAKKLRSAALPVIESYPGAAQDIMGIPRKRASLEFLKQGMGEFGISGDFLTTKVSHDEVDAVTAAAVALFFWGGRFEALGSEEEERLIVPDLHVIADAWKRRLVVGISGPIAAGKTSGSEFLKDRGFAYGRYSQVLKSMLENRRIKPTRTELQKFGERVHKRRGQRWLARQLVAKLPAGQDLVIDGMRFPDDHAFLIELFGPAFVHVHVTASEAVRGRRYVRDGNTLAQFAKACRHPVETRVPHLAALADNQVVNAGSKRAYHDKLNAIVCRRRRRSRVKAKKRPGVAE